jgi:hypothetical protein
MNERNFAGSQRGLGVLKHHRVAIQSDQPATRLDSAEDMRRMSAGTDGPIHDDLPRLRVEPVQNLRQQDRDMHRAGGRG